MIPICRDCKFSIERNRYLVNGWPCPPHLALACTKTIKKEFGVINGEWETSPLFCDDVRTWTKCGKKGK